MSQRYADESYDDPYDEYEYADDERPDGRQRKSSLGLMLIVAGSVVSIILLVLA